MLICRRKLWYACRSARLSYSNVVSDSRVSAFPNLLLCPGSPHPNALEILIGRDKKLWLADKAIDWSEAWNLSTPCIVRSWLFATDIHENDYDHSSTFKFSAPIHIWKSENHPKVLSLWKWAAVATLGLVSPAAATDRCHPIFFLKNLTTFFRRRLKVMTFCSCRLLVTPIFPRFSSVNSATKKF